MRHTFNDYMSRKRRHYEIKTLVIVTCYFAPEHKSYISVLKKASEKGKLYNFDMFNNFNKLKEKN